MRLKELSLEQQPRERLKEKGIETLSDSELIALLLDKGSKGENVIDLSHRLISTYSLQELNHLSLNELTELKGIGLAKASKILSAFELSKRVNGGKIVGKEITSAEDVARYYQEKLKDKKQEHFYAILLDTKNRVLSEELISIGTLNSSLIHPREVFKAAIKKSANAIILVHNHPSGSTEPSTEDFEITEKVKEAGQILGIKVLDHILVGKDDFKKV